MEAAEQFRRALDQIATLASTPVLRREQIKLQVALTTSLMHVRGFAAPQTRAAAEQSRLLIEQAEARGEPPEDPLLLLSVLYSFGTANILAFNSDVCCDFAAYVLALAERGKAKVPLIFGHDLMGASLLWAGDFAGSETISNRELRSTMLLRIVRWRRASAMTSEWLLSMMIFPHWLLGYPEAALAGVGQALKEAREIDHALTLMFALVWALNAHFYRGNYATAEALADELVAWQTKKAAPFGKPSELYSKVA